MTYVLGIDPGGTTGVAFLEFYSPNMPARIVWHTEIEGGFDGFINWLKPLHTFPDGTEFVCESFALDGRTPKPDLTPVEIIGALKVLIPPTRLTFQTNTQGKHLMTNEVLKRAGYYPKRGSVGGGHSTDALRHALTYVVKQLKHRPTVNLLFPREES